jgi:hypothetical protein
VRSSASLGPLLLPTLGKSWNSRKLGPGKLRLTYLADEACFGMVLVSTVIGHAANEE